MSRRRSHRRHRDRSEQGLADWFRAAPHGALHRWWRREQRKFYGRLPRLVGIFAILGRLRYASQHRFVVSAPHHRGIRTTIPD